MNCARELTFPHRGPLGNWAPPDLSIRSTNRVQPDQRILNNAAVIKQNHTVAQFNPGGGSNVKLTWADIEAHKSAVTALQWQRLAEYLRDGKTLSQVGRDEDPRCLKGPKELSIGRACIRILKSMLNERKASTEPGPPPFGSRDTANDSAPDDNGAAADTVAKTTPD